MQAEVSIDNRAQNKYRKLKETVTLTAATLPEAPSKILGLPSVGAPVECDPSDGDPFEADEHCTKCLFFVCFVIFYIYNE